MTSTVNQIRSSRRLGSLAGAWLGRAALATVALAWSGLGVAQTILEEVGINAQPGGRVELSFVMSDPPMDPQLFTTESPPRIAIDFPGTRSGLAERYLQVGTGATTGVSVVEAGGRVRVVVELVRTSSYQTLIDGNRFVLTVDNGIVGDSSQGAMAARDPTKGVSSGVAAVADIDFRRGRRGDGRILIQFNDERVSTDLRREGDRLVLDVFNASLPNELAQRLDVVDFATPVQFVETRARGNGTRMIISVAGNFEHLAYQAGTEYVVEVAPLAERVSDTSANFEEREYLGTAVTFNFQDIPVRSVLQLIADVSDLNIVVSDSTQGNVTLRLINVPWDQALDIVLQAKGLDQRRNGNVIWVAPAAEIAAREQALEDARIALEERAELSNAYIAISYGKAEDIARLLTEDSLSGGGGGGTAGAGATRRGFLSERGSVSFDRRTNTLLISDIPPRIAEVRELVALLDRPVEQVLIESRIVVANEDFARELGSRFGIAGGYEDRHRNLISLGGRLEGTDAMSNLGLVNRLAGRPTNFPTGLPGDINTSPRGLNGLAIPNLIDRLGVNLPATPGAPSYGFTILGQDYLLDLELSALETEGRGEVISSPRVITASQQEATIAQGQRVPFTTTQIDAGSGAVTTNVQFEEVQLSLKVTPIISPDQRIFMNLEVRQDNVAGFAPNGQAVIDTRNVITAVLVDNGQTVVLGGIYETAVRRSVEKVPGLGDVPIVGSLFRRTNKGASKSELLIFVTPKILAESLR